MKICTPGADEAPRLPRNSTPDGLLFRWCLKSTAGNMVRLTLDSPEFPDLAHLVLSDPRAFPRLSSITMRTFEEVDVVIKQIQQRLAHQREDS